LPSQRAFADQRLHLAGAANVHDETAAHEQAVAVLADLFPHPQRIGGGMLVEHAHPFGRAATQRGGKRARRHDVAGAVGHAEQRGVADELVGGKIDQARGRLAPRQRAAGVGDERHEDSLSSPAQGRGAERKRVR